MIDHAAKCLAVSSVIALCSLLAAGCACLNPVRAVSPAPTPAVASPQAPVAVPASPRPAPPEMPVAPSASTQVVPPEMPVAASASAKAPRQPPAAVAMTPAPPPHVAPKAAPAPAVPQQATAPLDFKSLEARLRQTPAIGVFTKLALKNQVDDLLDGFRAYHKRQGTTSLVELRRSFDMLLLKVLSLLQDADPPLARDIVKSRAAMWSILENRQKFTEFNLMAGANP